MNQNLRAVFRLDLPAIERSWPLAATSVVVLVLAVVSMFLPWHHFELQKGYTVEYGIGIASWVLVLALLMVAINVWLVFRHITVFSAIAVTVLAFFGIIGMYVDGANTAEQAGQYNRNPVFLSGFWVGLIAALLVPVAAVFAWRERPL